MVCIVPHFIIYLYNNHIYIRIQHGCACLKLEFGQISELPFCPENREYLGLFIDLIIKISGQKGNFFEIFQIFLYL